MTWAQFIFFFRKSCFLISTLALLYWSVAVFAEEYPNQLLWGDTHLHTSYSFDAFGGGNRTAGPDTAYRWAKGLPVLNPDSRERVQIETPLDFLVVADHAEMMGVLRAIDQGSDQPAQGSLLSRIKSWGAVNTLRFFTMNNGAGFSLVRDLAKKNYGPGKDFQIKGDPVKDPNNKLATDWLGDMSATEETAWDEIVDAAEAHNQPGKFTSLIGWEWTSAPMSANLHRVIFTPDGADVAKQFLPLGFDQTQYPEELWSWLDDVEEKTGGRFIAIPHNSNLSKGLMFSDTSLKGEPMTPDYARKRMKWESVVEITQTKGDSETHPDLSPQDEFADFEFYPYYIGQGKSTYKAGVGDFIRPTLKRGLAFEKSLGINPFKFGVIGSTDMHTGLSAAEENNYKGKMSFGSTPESQLKNYEGERNFATGWSMGAQGLAGVWAKENTREEIYAAFKRKEVYGTTGPRIRIRMFAGWDFDSSDSDAEDIALIGYTQGVPMGGNLTHARDNASPQLLIRAVKDPKGANLDRIQIVKAWLDKEGLSHEKIFNAAWSGDRQLGLLGELPAVGNTVDLLTGSYDNSIGAPELSIVWQDPDFDPERRALYYVRVLQIPTPRHALLDAIALKRELPDHIRGVIQERAYTSSVWYTP